MNGMLRLPRQVLFGAGALRATGPATRPLGSHAFVCTDPTIAASPAAERALASLQDAGVSVRTFAGTAPDVPLSCVEACLDQARRGPVDLVVGLGGGSCLDMAKIAALLLSHPGPIERFYGENRVPGPVLPVVAIPTTAGTGSEVTPVAVVSDPGHRLKVGVSSPLLVAALAICDPEATLGCPPSVAAFAGIDALVHAVEAHCAPARENPWDAFPGDVFRGRDILSAPFALRAVKLIGGSLERAVSDVDDIEARESMMLGSLCAGIAFAHAGTASAHALQYPIGAATGTPHGLGVGLLAPFALQAARPNADVALAEIASAFGVSDGTDDPPGAAIDEIQRLAAAVGVPGSLRALGVDADALAGYARDAAGIERLVRNSPRPMGEDDLLEILRAAWSGDRRGLTTTQASAP
jgi:alcohol dehydrogenase class IV